MNAKHTLGIKTPHQLLTHFSCMHRYVKSISNPFFLNIAMKISTLVIFLAACYKATCLELFDNSQLSSKSFLEQFDYDSLQDSKWILSRAQKSNNEPYSGKWSIEESSIYPGFPGDKGLVMKSDAAYFAISRKLPQVFENDGRDLVLQFEVKFQNGVSCSGGYIKLLTKTLDPEHFSSNTPFEIMFGPDICGSTNIVLFIIKTEGPDGTIESHVRTPPMARANPLTNLYTLVIRKNQDLEIRINGDVAKAGNIVSTPHFMEPPLNVPEFIADKDATKPEDWDDRIYISDPEAQKPADYDERYGSIWIRDPNTKKPEGWNDDATEFIDDPTSSKPQEWDDDEDGAWEPPTIRNPECSFGCGPWEAPLVINNEYKGLWSGPSIPNPNYSGIWKPPMIKNPAYSADGVQPFVKAVDGIGFEVWSMNSGIMFNNIYLGHSVKEAELIGNSTFVPKLELESKNYEETKPKPKHMPKPPPRTFEDILNDDSESRLSHMSAFLKGFVMGHVRAAQDFWYDFQLDPTITISKHPFRFAIYCLLFLTVFTTVFGLINVVMFILLQKKEEAAAEAKKFAEETDKPKIEELSDAEVIAQITGKSSGSKILASETRRRN